MLASPECSTSPLLSELARLCASSLSDLAGLSDLAESNLSHLADAGLLGAVYEQPITVFFFTGNFVKRLFVARARDANDAAHARIRGSASQSRLKTSSRRLARA